MGFYEKLIVGERSEPNIDDEAELTQLSKLISQ